MEELSVTLKTGNNINVSQWLIYMKYDTLSNGILNLKECGSLIHINMKRLLNMKRSLIHINMKTLLVFYLLLSQRQQNPWKAYSMTVWVKDRYMYEESMDGVYVHTNKLHG